MKELGGVCDIPMWILFGKLWSSMCLAILLNIIMCLYSRHNHSEQWNVRCVQPSAHFLMSATLNSILSAVMLELIYFINYRLGGSRLWWLGFIRETFNLPWAISFCLVVSSWLRDLKKPNTVCATDMNNTSNHVAYCSYLSERSDQFYCSII